MIFGKWAILLCAIVLMLGLGAVSPAPAQDNGQDVLPAPEGQPAGPQAVLSGRVISNYGPVPQARVRVAGLENFTLSDQGGYFNLRSPLPQQGQAMVTAGKQGWFNNGKPLGWTGSVGDIFLNPVFLADNPEYRFLSPLVCFTCHGRLTLTWDKSKMAHTTDNPKLLQMYYGTPAERRAGQGIAYKLSHPDSQGNCAVCHAPSAAANPLRSRDLEAILRSPLTEWDGISCDYCHKVRKVVSSANTPSGHTALLERQYPARGNSILVFGPYDDVVTPPMAASYAPVFAEGQFCSTCHSHFQTLPGGESWDYGKVYSEQEWKGFGLKGGRALPIQTTYQEWKGWQDSLAADDPNKGKRCQFCHMSWQKKLLPYYNFLVEGMALRMFRATFRSPRDIHPHLFEGGTKTQLQNAVALELEGKIKGQRLVVKVHVSNTNGGHWVPTGETMRNLILLVEAKDLEGKPLRLVQGGRLPLWAGQGDPQRGDYAGLPGAIFARVLADGEGRLNVPFWQASKIFSDTRLRPKTTRTLEFVYALRDPDDEPTAEARLIYRPVVRPLARAKGWQVPDIVITSKAW